MKKLCLNSGILVAQRLKRFFAKVTRFSQSLGHFTLGYAWTLGDSSVRMIFNIWYVKYIWCPSKVGTLRKLGTLGVTQN